MQEQISSMDLELRQSLSRGQSLEEEVQRKEEQIKRNEIEIKQCKNCITDRGEEVSSHCYTDNP